ncbi:MAG TPA: SCP2 sterol-binding domain-containing protein [Myxococcota bacterium]|nr:SCP2 sterol-binding domain-containing protein [Myxococcota bacterium]
MLTTTLENLLNRGLPRSPRARELTAALGGRSVALEVPGLAQLHLASTGVTLAVTAERAAADATLSGGPLAMLALLGAGGPGVVRRGAVEITGDALVAQQFQELIGLLRPDAEEELAVWLGDVPAHQLARGLRRAREFGRRAAATTLANAAEYLAHERADLVPRHEGEQFLRGVDGLREDLDRLAARVELLGNRRPAP